MQIFKDPTYTSEMHEMMDLYFELVCPFFLVLIQLSRFLEDHQISVFFSVHSQKISFFLLLLLSGQFSDKALKIMGTYKTVYNWLTYMNGKHEF